uniref:Uncharacterized protein n=1 Tax=Thermosporothrix sp. COM3 TaxID=2490863 RepID=A0A455SL22_9CHLR|nr:hypothetical protein KTC_28190 [Thermosporothrix sp. COM3]
MELQVVEVDIWIKRIEIYLKQTRARHPRTEEECHIELAITMNVYR